MFDAGLSTYCNAETERASFVASGWTITDGGKVCETVTPPVNSGGGG